MFRNSKLLRWLSSSFSKDSIQSCSMTRDFLSLSHMLIALPYLSTRRHNAHPHYELSARHRVPRAPPSLKSLILAGINEFPEESHRITLPRVASESATPSLSPTPAGTCNSASWNWIYSEEKGGRFDPLAENASRWRRGNGALDATNEIIKTSTPCISDDESRYQRR